MAEHEQYMEELSHNLANRIISLRDMFAEALRPPGERPPFTKVLSMPRALSWWSQHRYDKFGQAVLQNMSPESVLELDKALSEQNEEGL